jgi:copper transport protein
VLVLLVAAVALAPAAGAHASLAATEPADGARLDAAPGAVVLRFDQEVGASLGAVRVLDADGSRVDGGSVTIDGTTLRVALDDGLGEGAYVVGWRALSADSHPIRGAFSFTVGDAGPVTDGGFAAVLGEGDDRPWEIAGAVARALSYAGALLAAGLAVFLLAAHDGGPEGPRLRRRLRQAAGVGAVGVLAALPVQAALATGLGAGALLEAGVAGDVLGEGVGWSTAVVLAGLALLVADAGRRAPVSGAGAVLATAGFALAGHATSSEPRWLAMAGDVIHVAAGATWIGGLWGLAVVLRRRGPGDEVAAGAVVARTSAVAAVALLAVAVAGSALAWSEVRALSALTGTTYGRLLLAKLAVVAAVAGMGWWNRSRLVPALAGAARAPAPALAAVGGAGATSGPVPDATGAADRHDHAAGRDDRAAGRDDRATAAPGGLSPGARLRRTVTVEGVALLVAVALTAVLVQVTPARSAAGLGGPFSTTVALGSGTVNVVSDPPRPGTGQLHLYVLDEDGRAPALEALELRLTLESADVGPLERTPVVAGPGHWILDGRELALAGEWTVEIVARVDAFTRETASVVVPLRS